MMRKALLLAALAIPASAAAASAQAFGVYDWTGPYGGVNAGYADGDFDLEAFLFIDEDTDFFPDELAGGEFPTSRSFSGDGYVAGIYGGWNLQMGNVVVGLEGDIQYSDVSSSAHIPNAPGGADDNPDGATEFGFDVGYYGTLRGRAGWAWERLLVYATAGGAMGSVNFDRGYRVGSELLQESASNTRYGWTAGAGVEFALDEFWTVRGEYMRVDLGSDRFDTTYTDGTAAFADIDTRFDTFRVGVGLRF
jgi:outer membrane immunogenic protein